MFNFAKIGEVVTDPRDVGQLAPPPPPSPPYGNGNHEQSTLKTNGEADSQSVPQKRKFVEITLDTPLRALSRFFEWNSAAVVTEKEGGEAGWMKPVAVVTKVDLLAWLVKQGKMDGINGSA